MNKAIFLLIVALTGCVTSQSRNDCFEFGVRQCVAFFARLDDTDRNSSAGRNLWNEICQADGIRCVEEKDVEPFSVKLRMAKQGYANIWFLGGAKEIRGIFQTASTDKSHQEHLDATIRLSKQIEACDQKNIDSCEQVFKQSDWGGGFLFMLGVPNDAWQRARQHLCSDKNYQCLTINEIKPYDPPKGWTILSNSTSTGFANGKQKSKREVVLKKGT